MISLNLCNSIVQFLSSSLPTVGKSACQEYEKFARVGYICCLSNICMYVWMDSDYWYHSVFVP